MTSMQIECENKKITRDVLEDKSITSNGVE